MFKLCSSLVLLIACAACGGSFSGGDGPSGSAGRSGDGVGGELNAGGTSAGGDTGAGSDGGSATGGTGASVGQGGGSSVAGAGAGSGGSGASAGSSSGATCATLKQDYQAALEKARACDKGSTDQCSVSSTLEPIGCGCSVLVNSKSEYTAVAKKARQAYRDAECVDSSICPAIACAPITDASCAVGTSGGNFVCTAAFIR